MTNQTLPTEQLLVVPTSGYTLPLNLLAPYTEQGYTLVRFEVLTQELVLLHIRLTELSVLNG